MHLGSTNGTTRTLRMLSSSALRAYSIFTSMFSASAVVALSAACKSKAESRGLILKAFKPGVAAGTLRSDRGGLGTRVTECSLKHSQLHSFKCMRTCHCHASKRERTSVCTGHHTSGCCLSAERYFADSKDSHRASAAAPSAARTTWLSSSAGGAGPAPCASPASAPASA